MWIGFKERKGMASGDNQNQAANQWLQGIVYQLP
jgi:hypothetical protein